MTKSVPKLSQSQRITRGIALATGNSLQSRPHTHNAVQQRANTPRSSAGDRSPSPPLFIEGGVQQPAGMRRTFSIDSETSEAAQAIDAVLRETLTLPDEVVVHPPV